MQRSCVKEVALSRYRVVEVCAGAIHPLARRHQRGDLIPDPRPNPW